MAYNIKLEPLSKEDRKEIRKNIIGAAIFLVFAAGIFTFMINMMGSISLEDGVSYVFMGFGAFFLLIIGIIAGGAALDLQSGKKQVITGTVTDKERYKSRSTGRKRKSSTPHYYLYFDDKKVEVQLKHFSDVSVGDEVELHYGKWSRKSLSIFHLKKSESGESVPVVEEKKSARERLNEWKEERASVEKKEYPLNKEDLKVLARKRNSKLFINFFILIFFIIMTLGFSIGSMVDWVFMIPQVIFLTIIFFSFKWIRQCFIKYGKDKKSEVKVVAIAKVKDKQINSGSGKSYSVSTTYGSFPVDKSVYDNIEVGGTLYSFHGKHSNWLIGFHTEESGYVSA